MATTPLEASSAMRSQFQAQWCLTGPDQTVEWVRAGGCKLEPLPRPSGVLAIGGDHDVWIRLQVEPVGDVAEFWLTLGNERLQRVTLHQPAASGGWQTQQRGRALPLAQHSEPARTHAAFSLPMAGETSREFWLHIQSNSLIHVDPELWTPETFRALRLRHDSLWMLLSGMGLSLVLLAVVFAVRAREASTLWFACAFGGCATINVHSSSVLQRSFWPGHWPMPEGLWLLGAMAFVIGGAGSLWHATRARGEASREFQWPKGRDLIADLLIALGLWVVVVLLRILQVYGHWPSDPSGESVLMLLSFGAGGWFFWALLRHSARGHREANLIRRSSVSQLAMFARVSHELRTPLDTILGNAQLLLQKRDQPPALPILRAMLDSGRHLLGMLDELLDYARGVSGVLKVEPVATHFGAWWAGLERTGELLAERNRNRFVSRLDIGDPMQRRAVFRFDAARLRQVVDNLLVNAARYSRDGTITLGARIGFDSDAPGHAVLNLYVEDTGCGIDPRDHERIFEPFERLDRTTLAGGQGTGMGLAISRQLIALMGGQLTVLSSRGRGARFTVCVPIELSNEELPAVLDLPLSTASLPEGVRRCALVVDDDDHSRHVLVNLLRNAGFEVLEVSGGHEAERCLEAGQYFDVVLTDQFMPEGDGWWVLWASERYLPGTPVILISAALPFEPLGWKGTRKFSATFLRPLNHEGLLRKLGELLDLRWQFEQRFAADAARPTQRPGRLALAELAQLIAFGEVTAIREWAQSLRTREPQFAEFADAVEQAVTELDFGRLELLVAEV